MWLEGLSMSQDYAKKCPTCGGGVRRRNLREMHAGSSIFDGKRVDIRKRPAEGFADPVYLDPITQYFDGRLYRMWPSERYLSRGGRLHRYAWVAAFGPVPDGCHIHHRDDDVLNNSLRNLECVPASLHLSHTWRNGHEHLLRQTSTSRMQPRGRRMASIRGGKVVASTPRRTRKGRNASESLGLAKTAARLFRRLFAGAQPQRFCSEVCKAGAIEHVAPLNERADVWDLTVPDAECFRW